MKTLLIGLTVAVVIGALLDLGVFGFQLAQFGRINANTNLTTCWAHVLNRAVTDHPTHASLLREARVCAKLPA